MILDKARPEEAERCSVIINDGRAFQKAQGFEQWTDDYPNLDTIKEDIKNGKGYVLRDKDCIAAYMCIDLDGEPAYNDIRGIWRLDEPYAVVHRMAFCADKQGKGLSTEAFRLIDEACLSMGVRYIRIDTAPDNKRMQHVMEKNGFVRCGVIVFQGSDKWAYDKIIKGTAAN